MIYLKERINFPLKFTIPKFHHVHLYIDNLKWNRKEMIQKAISHVSHFWKLMQKKMLNLVVNMVWVYIYAAIYLYIPFATNFSRGACNHRANHPDKVYWFLECVNTRPFSLLLCWQMVSFLFITTTRLSDTHALIKLKKMNRKKECYTLQTWF